MITLNPLRRALVPVDSAAAQRISAPNYDEFQGDHEIWQRLQRHPDSVLRITMPHCAVATADAVLEEGSSEALLRAQELMAELESSALTRTTENVMAVYEIVDPRRPATRQIGLLAMARIAEIRSAANPQGSIIRNEGVREKKAQGRADLIRATRAMIGTVNNAIEDAQGRVTEALVAYADDRPCDYSAEDDVGNGHRIWLITDRGVTRTMIELFAAEPCAYVADGNHRSAAAALLGDSEFLSVFFPARTMGLAPYNRLVQAPQLEAQDLVQALSPAFEVETLPAAARAPFQPTAVHDIGLYTQGTWYRLTPKPSAYDPADAVQVIDASIVQRKLFDPVLRITDPRDERLTFVGGNRDAHYLQARVDDGESSYAVTLAPVTMEQFIAVCRQNRIMPPKSTWFQPKIRSGLVMALLD